MPPKVYHYEPKIFGFKIAGKRGSKTFDPPKGNVRYIEDSMQALELEQVKEKQAAAANDLALDFKGKLNLNSQDSNENTAATGEDGELTNR